jgi:hypothetical protein
MFDWLFKTKEEKEKFAETVLNTALNGNTHDSIIAGLFILDVISTANNESKVEVKK